MSIRAYRVKEIQHENTDSFNLWHNEEFVDILRNAGWLKSLNIDGCGIFEISVEALKEIINELSPTADNKELIDSLCEDIESTRANDEEYISYYCY